MTPLYRDPATHAAAAPRPGLSWRDPAALIVAGLVVILGTLLVGGRAVPVEFWTVVVAALGYLFGSHGTATGQGQILAILNGNAARALAPHLAALPGGRRATDPPAPSGSPVPPLEANR